MSGSQPERRHGGIEQIEARKKEEQDRFRRSDETRSVLKDIERSIKRIHETTANQPVLTEMVSAMEHINKAQALIAADHGFDRGLLEGLEIALDILQAEWKGRS